MMEKITGPTEMLSSKPSVNPFNNASKERKEAKAEAKEEAEAKE